MKSYKYLLTLLLSLSCLMGLLGQTNKKTLNYQAVILDPKAIDIPGVSIVGQPLNKGNVCLRFSLINAQGGLDYEETQQVTTDEYGLVNVAIGAGAQAQSGNSTSIYKSFESVVWNSSVKSLKVSVSYDGCSSFKQVSSQAFNYTPYALYAEAVDYKNVKDAPTKLSQFSNDAGYLIPKDLDPLKSDIQTNSSKIEVANKLITDNKQASDASFLVVNQSITSLDTKVAANTTAIKENTSSITNISTKLTDQQNQIYDNRNQITATNNNLNTQIGGLQGQLNTTNSTVSNLTGTAEVVSNKSTAVDLGGTNPSDQAYPSQKAAKAYVDQVVSQIATSGVPDATTLAAGKLQLAGDLSGTATNPTVPALAGKENSSNKSTAIDLGAGNPSDQLYPSQKATKAYVDNSIYAAVGTGVPDATTNAAGKVKLAGDLAGTAASPTVPGLLLKEDVSNKSNAALGTSTTLYPTQNAVKTYVDSQVASATIVDADASTRGKIQLAGDLAGTAAAPTVPGLVLKANLNSPSFTGAPTAPTQTSGDNSTKLATTAYVDAQVASGAVDATTSTKGIVKLTGDLGGTATSPTVPGLALKANTADVTTSLALKEDVSNKSNGALGTSITLYPTQSAVKTYVDAQVASATIVDADGSTKGKIQLSGDLAGSATSPSVVKLRGTAVSSVAPVTAGHVLTYDATGSGVAYWAAPQNSANTISGVVPVANGGTGLSSLTSGGAVYASSSSALTTGTLPLTAGGTGAITAPAALTSLGAAPLASPTFTGTVTAPIYASAPQALTDAATISWNPANGLNASVTLGGNRTLSFSATPASGSYGTLVIIQDGTGGRTLTLPSGTNKVLGSTSTTTIALSTAANAKDILNFYFDGTTYFWNIGQGYGAVATVTANNIDGGAAGSLPYQTGAGTTGFLAKGTDGQILTLASGVPSWSAAAATGVTSVAMTTPTGLSITGSPIISSGTLALSLTSGYAIPTTSSQTNWDAAYTNRITSATSPLSISSNALSLGTVSVANGGTGLTAAPTNGQILIGNGTGFALATLTAGTGVSLTNGAGSITINAAARSWTDQPTVTANQTSFSLTYAPTASSKIWMFINGVRTNNNAYSFSGQTVTYVPSNNGAYAITASDRVQFDYTY